MSFGAFDFSHPRHTPAPTFGAVSKCRIGVCGIGVCAVVKPRPATLLGWVLCNRGYGDATITFYDQVNAPSDEDVADWPLVLAPGQPAAVGFPMEIPFFRGLAYRVDGEVDGVLLYS
jgi:hypothetical protein